MLRLPEILRPALAALRRPRPPVSPLAALDLRPVVAELALPSEPETGGTPAPATRGRSGRAIRFDEAGRRWERVFDCPRDRRRMAQHEAVQRFAAWMRAEGFDGWHTAADVLGFYAWWAEAHAVEVMCPEHLYERLASAPGVTRERRRIASATDPDMVRLRRQSGELRPTLYHIASEAELRDGSAAARRDGSASAAPKPSPAAAPETRSCSRQPASVVPEARASRHQRAA